MSHLHFIYFSANPLLLFFKENSVTGSDDLFFSLQLKWQSQWVAQKKKQEKWVASEKRLGTTAVGASVQIYFSKNGFLEL